METIVDPNFSIVVPGGCNAKCKFCFWEREKYSKKKFLKGLEKTLDGLPEQFWKVSITGGEPTLSEMFFPVLEALRKRKQRWPKVVLTTNGTFLGGRIPKMEGVVDFVNISRHAVNEAENRKRFGTNGVPMRQEIMQLNIALNKVGIESTMNVVISDEYQPDFGILLDMAKDKCFSAICLRKEHREGCDLEPTEMEESLREDYKVISETTCPVCRSTIQIIHGMKIIWQASIPEPSDKMDEIYEVILQPDGNLYADWSKKVPLEV